MDERELHESGGKNRPRQVRRKRKDGWTERKKRIFLDTLAATSNVTLSAEAAGIEPCNAYSLALRDPQFAEDWRSALEVVELRAEGALLERGLKLKLVPKEKAGDEGPTVVADVAEMDTALLIDILRRRQARLSRGTRGGPAPKGASKAETDAAILKHLKAYKKRLERQSRARGAGGAR